ncbi:MAG: glycoside hydrolase [Pseudomonadota bacterium]
MNGAADRRLRVVLCWHMHQPHYRDLVTGEFVQPWTYLHGIKDYVDMAQHLEAVPGACAVVNFTPTLLEQLDDYSAAIGAWLRTGQRIPDRLLAALADGAPASPAEWPELMQACLRANRDHLVHRFAPFRELVERAEHLLREWGLDPAGSPPVFSGGLIHPDEDAIEGGGGGAGGGNADADAAHARLVAGLRAFAASADPRSFLDDLVTWYHLAWLGESIRRGDARAQELIAKARGYGVGDRRLLVEIVGDALAGLVPRYRRLMGSGQVELSVTPWGHPIVPLLLDFESAREALPGVPLPADADYPGGESRARWHVARAIQDFARAFGVRPRGCWPAEGAVSTRTVQLLDSFGFDWLATGEGVLRGSLERAGAVPGPSTLNRPWRVAGSRAVTFFRHEEISDRIGFVYSKWHGDDAARDFVHRLEHLADLYGDDPSRTVAIVLDGENAWEHYPYNGWYFLNNVYRALADHPRLRLATFSQALAEGGAEAELPALRAGSWVHGTLSTWVGCPAKNRAWEMLCDAKRTYDQVMVEGGLDDGAQARAEIQLAVCEGSDWPWWFGDYNPSGTVASFDALYRRHLANLYRLLEEPPPDYLGRAFAGGLEASRAGDDAEQVDTMRRAI